MSSNQTTKVPAYLPYQKQFTPYKWYKPLLALLVAFGFFLVFSTVLTVIGGIIAQNQGYDLQKLLMGGYDTLDGDYAAGGFSWKQDHQRPSGFVDIFFARRF